MSPHPSIPESLWGTVPPEAQAAIVAVIASLGKRIADLEARLNQNSTNSSKAAFDRSPRREGHAAISGPTIRAQAGRPARPQAAYPGDGPSRTAPRDLRGQADALRGLRRHASG